MKYIVNQDIDINSGNLVNNILLSRGIERDKLLRYLWPTSEELSPADLLDNTDRGASLLNYHLQSGSDILIIVDCDCDGFTSAAEMYLYIKHYYPDANVSYFLHDEKQHGIERAKMEDQYYDLVIVPDAGSNQEDDCLWLNEIGTDVLILDHHEAEPFTMTDYYPRYTVVINPFVSEKGNKNLTGAGVVYNFLRYHESNFIDNGDFAEKLIDLAAVGIIGDMADARDLEVRYIAFNGFKNLYNPGLKALFAKQAYSIFGSEKFTQSDLARISPYNISFYIAPLINSIIRVGTMEEKEILFKGLINGDTRIQSTKRGAKPGDTESYAEMAARIGTNCHNRQNKIVDAIVNDINFKIEREDLNTHSVLLIPLSFDEAINIPQPVTGLVAMKLARAYGKPTLVLRETPDDCYAGSGRGLNNSELNDFKAFLDSSEMFEYAQGHAQAFGAKIKRAKVDRFLAWADVNLDMSTIDTNYYFVDFKFDSDVTREQMERVARACDELTPMFDKNIAPPLAVVEDITITPEMIQVIGRDSSTAKFYYKGINFIKFKDFNFIENVEQGVISNLTVLGEFGVNNYMGRKSYQFIIKDYEMESQI